MRNGICLSLAAAALISTASLIAARPAAPGHVQLDCPAPPGWQEVLRQNPRFVVFGELHGTEQAPQFITNLVCAEAMKGRPVLLGIERDANFDAALQEAWALPSAQFAPALAKLGWAGRQDGISSKASFDMVVRLHLLKERGLPIHIVAFNGARDKAQHDRFAHLPGQGGHEAAQAENIAKAAAARSPVTTIVLVGNLHARKLPVARAGKSFDPMALQLAQNGKVVTLDMVYDAGTAWNCLLKPGSNPAPGKPVGPSDMTCGPSPTAGTTKFTASPFIRLHQPHGSGQEAAFDGIFWVGPVKASAPAFR